MPTYRDRGFVLKTKTLRDADRHYTMYTEQHGKVVLLAKGSRRGRSKMSPHLAGFGMVELMVAKGKLIDRMAGASLVTPYRGILESLPKTAVAQSFLLAMDALTKREFPDERLFTLLAEFFQALEAGDEPSAGRNLLFDAGVAKLLEMLGHGLELGVCVGCRQMLVPAGNAMNVLRGGVECLGCKGPMSMDIGADAIKALRFLRTEPFLAASTLRLDDRCRRETAFVTDLLLMSHLEERFSALRYMKTVA
jgi:DNA repair protein RecO (recombination protein O)